MAFAQQVLDLLGHPGLESAFPAPGSPYPRGAPPAPGPPRRLTNSGASSSRIRRTAMRTSSTRSSGSARGVAFLAGLGSLRGLGRLASASGRPWRPNWESRLVQLRVAGALILTLARSGLFLAAQLMQKILQLALLPAGRLRLRLGQQPHLGHELVHVVLRAGGGDWALSSAKIRSNSPKSLSRSRFGLGLGILLFGLDHVGQVDNRGAGRRCLRLIHQKAPHYRGDNLRRKLTHSLSPGNWGRGTGPPGATPLRRLPRPDGAGGAKRPGCAGRPSGCPWGSP